MNSSLFFSYPFIIHKPPNCFLFLAGFFSIWNIPFWPPEPSRTNPCSLPARRALLTENYSHAKMLKFTKHLVSDMKNSRSWSSCFHLQKQSWRKTGGLSFDCCCWLAKWRGEGKRQLTATLTARTKSYPLFLNPAVSTLFLLSFLFFFFFIAGFNVIFKLELKQTMEHEITTKCKFTYISELNFLLHLQSKILPFELWAPIAFNGRQQTPDITWNIHALILLLQVSLAELKESFSTRQYLSGVIPNE